MDDGSYNGVPSSALVLSNQDAALLTAFLSLYTTVAGTSLWRIVAFCLHQSRVDETSSKDALFHQQQALLRNVETPISAVWQLVRLAFTWRKKTKKPFVRSTGLIVSASTALVTAAAAALMTSKVVTKSPQSAGFQTISTHGIEVIVVLGTVIILLGNILDIGIAFFQLRLGHGQSRRLAWALDEKLQLQRLAYEGQGWGPFTHGTGSVPVTKEGLLLGLHDLDDPDHPTISRNPTPNRDAGFWVDRPRGRGKTQADGDHTNGRGFALTTLSPSGERRSSSAVAYGLGGVRRLRIVNAGQVDGARDSKSSSPPHRRRHSIASTGVNPNNASAVSVASNHSSGGKERRSLHATAAAATGPRSVRDALAANNASAVSVSSRTSAFREDLPELRELLQTDAGTALVQQHTQHLLEPVQEHGDQGSVASAEGQGPNTSLPYRHLSAEGGGGYAHRAEVYGSRALQEVEMARSGAKAERESSRKGDGGEVAERSEEGGTKNVRSQDLRALEEGKGGVKEGGLSRTG